MRSDIQDLLNVAGGLFSKKVTLDSLHQELAEHFYPERADFIVNRWLGEEFMQNLSTSYPVIARRDLGNSISSMLRPRSQHWFKISAGDTQTDIAGDRWLEMATTIQKRAMYDRDAQFVRATKEADHDYVTFGNAVVSVEMNNKKNSLMYRCWHLRDVAWLEDYDGSICEVYRRSCPSAAKLMSEFKGNVSGQAKEVYEKTPHAEIKYYHIVLPKDRYKGEMPVGSDYVSIYVEEKTGHVLREEPVQSMIYVIPRWQTVSGSQYAYSPATVAALPDARLIQSVT